jgi:hypothetical protein
MNLYFLGEALCELKPCYVLKGTFSSLCVNKQSVLMLIIIHPLFLSFQKDASDVHTPQLLLFQSDQGSRQMTFSAQKIFKFTKCML